MTDGAPAAWERVRGEVAKVVVGQEAALEHLVTAMVVGGHVLLEGVPGVAKTLLAKALAHSLDADYRRIQFSPDLMPADIIGTNVYNLADNQFRLIKGPIFTEVLLADEINRTPPKTQAALIEAMEERQVTIDGTRHQLPDRFFVIATQNPLEFEGTFPLPEAQVDRFLLKVVVNYPETDEELEILRRHHAGLDPHDLDAAGVRPVLTADDWARMRAAANAVTVEDGILQYIQRIVAATRQSREVALGGSPRAAIGLLRTSKALAALRGLDFVTPEQIKAMTLPVMRHRLILRPEAEVEGRTATDVLRNVLGAIEVPR